MLSAGAAKQAAGEMGARRAWSIRWATSQGGLDALIGPIDLAETTRPFPRARRWITFPARVCFVRGP